MKQRPTNDKAFEEWLDDWYQGSKEAGGDVVMSESEFKNWSRGIKNMYNKPMEWSEDDEDFINMLILHFNYLIDKGGNSVETYKSYKEKLKSFCHYPKQE